MLWPVVPDIQNLVLRMFAAVDILNLEQNKLAALAAVVDIQNWEPSMLAVVVVVDIQSLERSKLVVVVVDILSLERSKLVVVVVDIQSLERYKLAAVVVVAVADIHCRTKSRLWVSRWMLVKYWYFDSYLGLNMQLVDKLVSGSCFDSELHLR